MQKQEALEVLNEIMKKCVLPRSITIESSNPEAPLDKQKFTLRIKSGFVAKDWTCLKEIVQKRNLSLKETGDYFTIYRERSP